MADNQQEDKTESPSPKRLNEAREKGQVPRSKEFSTFLSVAFVLGVVSSMASFIYERANIAMKTALSIPAAATKNPTAMSDHLAQLWPQLPAMFMPAMVAAIAAALLGPMGTRSYVFVPSKLAPKLSNLNPSNWVSNVFSWNGVSEIIKSAVKAIALGLVAYMAYTTKQEELFNSVGLGLQGSLNAAADMTIKVTIWLSLVLFVIAGADIPFQIWNYTNRLKMTRQEVKEESKDTEGNPEIKARVRSAQRELAKRRMIEDVKKADVVVTNPTHYAVAMSYKEGIHSAPVVLAKGVDDIAQKIKEIAKEAKIPVIESPKLARAIYANTELEREIPEALYVAVAKVLNFAFSLKAFESGFGKEPKLAEFSVPDDLDPHFQDAKKID